MSMIKVIAPGSYDFGEQVAQMIKISNEGLRGNDLKTFIKRAGESFARRVKDINFKEGEVPIHLIALGSTEGTGINKNFDGFRDRMLKQYHDTFVKHARFYRAHKNKDKSKSYGIVKESTFNEPMKRVELIVALNGTKEAAERNGGLIADKELEKLARGDDLAVSMAIKVPFDKCSFCGNKAKSRAEYCDDIEKGGMCKAGGLKHNIGRILADGHILHADNTEGDFFDISDVYKPADRIAYVFGKVASSANISGAELAEQLNITAPFEILFSELENTKTLDYIKAAYKLAEAETKYENNPSLIYERAFTSDVQQNNFTTPFDKQSSLNALAAHNISLPLPLFLSFITNTPPEKCASLSENSLNYLPGVFNKLIKDANLEVILTNNPFKSFSSLASTSQKQWASKYASDYSINKEAIKNRVFLSALRNPENPTIKKASRIIQNNEFHKVATLYALYKIGLLCDINQKSKSDMTADLLVTQNYVN